MKIWWAWLSTWIWINRHYNKVAKPKYHQYGPYHSDRGGGAVKLPVERKSSQLTLQLHADVAILLSHQGNLGLPVGSTVTSWQTGTNHLTQVGEESFDGRSQTSVQLLGGRKQDLFNKRKKCIWIDCLILISVYLRPLLDGCWVHALLPHTVHVCQEDVIRRFTKPALGEQLAAADAHRKPGMLQEDLRGSSEGLHHGPETRIQTEMLNRNQRFSQC